MNVLLVGSGGREHALAWKLAQSPLLDTLFIAPGNPGTAQFGRNVPVDVASTALLVDIARREQVGLVIIGPEAPLAAGLADACIAAGIPVFGPTQAAARIESSKAFAKQMMAQAQVATAQSHIFDDANQAIAFVRAGQTAWVVKADGLASGKGVILADDVDATIAAITQIAATGAGQRIVLEERMSGPEVSVIALCDGAQLWAFPPARDHKRLRDGDAGPNTGGMGAVAPVDLSDDMVDEIVQRLMLPVVQALAEAGTPFRGALYAGVMLTDDGPRILEFNARFGDPETQVLLPLVDGDLLAALLACANGALQPETLRWRSEAAACVVLAAAGYPEAPRGGDAISGLEALEATDVIVFHAGTAWEAGQIVVAGGRVLGVTGHAATLTAALASAYEAIEDISFEGMQFRRDVGHTT